MVIRRFVPYTLEDLGVIVRHCSSFPKRWEWFWPNFTAVTPQVVLRNTVVAYHNRHGKEHVIPKDVRGIGEVGQITVFCDPKVNYTGPTVQALQVCQARLVARVDDDIKLKQDWAQGVLALFNEEPHFKMLGRVVACGPPYAKFKDKLYAPWLHELLEHGTNLCWGFLAGGFLVANRAIWVSYYPLVDQHFDSKYGPDAYFFCLAARADGVEAKSIGGYWGHCGFRHGNGILPGR